MAVALIRTFPMLPGFFRMVRAGGCCLPRRLALVLLEQIPGLEPGLADWKSAVLPVERHLRNWLQRLDSNQRSLGYEPSEDVHSSTMHKNGTGALPPS